MGDPTNTQLLMKLDAVLTSILPTNPNQINIPEGAVLFEHKGKAEIISEIDTILTSHTQAQEKSEPFSLSFISKHRSNILYSDQHHLFYGPKQDTVSSAEKPKAFEHILRMLKIIRETLAKDTIETKRGKVPSQY